MKKKSLVIVGRECVGAEGESDWWDGKEKVVEKKEVEVVRYEEGGGGGEGVEMGQ